MVDTQTGVGPRQEFVLGRELILGHELILGKEPVKKESDTVTS